MFLDSQNVVNQDYYKEIKDNIICSICKGILYNPVQCSKCQNCFCKKCIDKWKQVNNKCPFKCEKNSYQSNRFITNILSKLIFQCKNGCNAEIEYDKIKKHYTEECPKIDYKKAYFHLLKKYKELSSTTTIKKFPMNHIHDLKSLKLNEKHVCDICAKNIEKDQHCFSCIQCNLYLCDTCSVQLYTTKIKHRHNNILLIKKNLIKCSICKGECYGNLALHCNICKTNCCILCFMN
jgi:hypothetical protein